MINIIIPFAIDKNLGKEYNRMINNIPDNEWVCILDYDVMFLTPNAPNILFNYALQNPNSLLTCYTNRIHQSSPQLFNGSLSMNSQIKHHIEIARELEHRAYKTKKLNSTISGFLMLFPKSLWKDFKFNENLRCLGVDSDFSTRLVQAGKQVLLMEALYVFHQYRIMTDQHDKSHLLS